jgi:syntaxin 16
VLRISQRERRVVARPSIDDETADIARTETLVRALSDRLKWLRERITRLRKVGGAESEMENCLQRNVQAGLAMELQRLSTDLRREQGAYLQKLEERRRQTLRFTDMAGTSAPRPAAYAFNDANSALFLEQAVDNNAVLVAAREKEISSVLRSMEELNGLFSDMSEIIHGQRALVDRIDYNIVTAESHAEDAVEELQQAERYARKSCRQRVTIGLAIAIVGMVFALLLKASLS